MPRQLHRDEYTVGWVCALPIELAAAQEMLDDEHADLERDPADNDENLYALGSIGGHNVAIVCLPAGRIGNNPAATVATQMRATFKGIRFGLMVGIGGGVPSVEADIRLGDVVVSQPHGAFGGVVQYDSGKTTTGGFERTGLLNAPPQILLAAVARVQASQLRGRSKLSEHVLKIGRIPQFQRKGAGPDILFEAAYDHQGGHTCDKCSMDRQEVRQPRDSEEIVVHYGTIASGNKVIKNAAQRDKVSAKLGGVLCFEMEAAGLMNSFPCLAIRGICDYADSHKNKTWQPYAAGTAAAYAKELLLVIPSIDVTETRSIKEATREPSDTRPTTAFQAMEQRRREDHQICSLGKSLDPNLSALSRTIEPSPSLESSRRTVMADLQPASSARSSESKLDSPILSDEQRKEMITSLHFNQRDARLLTLKPAQAKTCRWMIKNVHYRDWMEAEKLNHHRGFFWIKGKPGAGKSVMMKFLFSEARKTMKGCLILSFFFNARGEHLEKSTSGLYRALLLQLLEKAPETWGIFNYYGIHGFETIKNTGWQNETLRELFALALQELGNQRVVCYVDALDECPEDDVCDMISFFEELGELEKAAEFRVCFSSRHYPEISIRTGLQLVLESEQEHTNDITLYVDTHLKLGKNEAEDIKAEILRKSSGIFLWVHLVIPILNKEYDRGRIKALKKRLAEIPTGLHNLFLDMLTRDHNNMGYFLVCLQVIIFAARPLRPDEFRIAVEQYCEDDYAPGQCNSIQMTSENLRKFVLDTSKGLAEITRSKEPTVQFIHESVRDFLLKEGGMNKLQPGIVNPEGLGHNTLKKICSLQLAFFQRGMNSSDIMYIAATSDQRQKQLAKEYPLLQYAVENVFYHANWAQKLKLDQVSFLENFDMQAWALARKMVRAQAYYYKESPYLLYFLSESGSADLIRVYPQRNQHFELKGGQFVYPLLAALFAGHSVAARALVNLPSLPEEEPTTKAQAKSRSNFALKKDNFKKSRHILSFLCEFGDTDILRAVWESKHSDINSSIANECLAYASSEAVVDTLAELGACTVLYTGNKDDIRVLPSLRDNEPLLPNNLHYLESILKKYPPTIRKTEVWGQFGSLLSYAAAKGFDQIARLCVKDTTAASRQGVIISAMCGSINQSGRASIIRYLIQEGVQVDSRGNQDIIRMLFNMICRPHNEEVVASLLAAPFLDLETKNSEGMTSLYWAVQQGRKAYVKLFLSAGSDPTARSNDGTSVLILAVKVGDLSSFRYILEHAKCEPNAQDGNGRTALSWCATVADECAIAMVSDLLKRPDVDPNIKENSGQTVLMRAVQSGNPKLVEALLQSSVIVPDLGSCHRSTPLRLAFKLYREDRHEVFWEISRLLLLTFKVNPDCQQKLPTPVAIASKFDLTQLVELLEVFYRCRAALESEPSGPFDQELKDLRWNGGLGST